MFEEYSDIVQVPCITVKGIVQQPLSDYSKLDVSTLRTVATALGGEVTYLKVRATVSPCEIDLCTYRECFRPAVKGSTGQRCDDHVL
jgi:hypothetical protein